MYSLLAIPFLGALAMAQSQSQDESQQLKSIINEAGVSITNSISPAQVTAIEADALGLGTALMADFSQSDEEHGDELSSILATATGTIPSPDQLRSMDSIIEQFKTASADVAPYYTSLNAIASPFPIAAIESARLSDIGEAKSVASVGILEALATDLSIPVPTIAAATGPVTGTASSGATTMMSMQTSGASVAASSTTSSSSAGAVPAVTAAPRMVVGAAAAAAAGLVGVAFL